MRRRHAAEIRRGIITAREVIRGARVGPRLTPFGFNGAPSMPLWEKSYHREITRAVLDGRIRPPKGPSGVGRR